MGIAGQINCVEPAYGLRSNSGMPEKSLRGCIIATTQMFGLVRRIVKISRTASMRTSSTHAKRCLGP
jgi:hypothetical protein